MPAIERPMPAALTGSMGDIFFPGITRVHGIQCNACDRYGGFNDD